MMQIHSEYGDLITTITSENGLLMTLIIYIGPNTTLKHSYSSVTLSSMVGSIKVADC